MTHVSGTRVELELITSNSGVVKEHKGVSLGSVMGDQWNSNAMVVSY